jgi:hypothetical protein
MALLLTVAPTRVAVDTRRVIVEAAIGSEALLLLGFDRQVMPVRSALRRIGVLIRELEER